MPSTRPAASDGRDGPRLTLRLDLGAGLRIGPGKVLLLEEVGRTGSISAAGRALKMSYRRAWLLIEDLNTGLGTPVVETATGGSGGGGARLTPAGEAVIRNYRRIEAAADKAARPDIQAILAVRKA